MKIAICFSGQPRFIEEGYSLLYQNLIRHYNTDVFGHLWFDESLTNSPYKFGGNGGWESQRISSSAIDAFRDLYKPVALNVEKSKEFYDKTLDDSFEKSQNTYWPGSVNNSLEPNYRKRQINNTLSNFYSMSKSCLLKSEREYLVGEKYDWVFKIRTDCLLDTPLNLRIFNPEHINVTGLQQPAPNINDWLCFSGSEQMDVLMSIFPTFKSILKKTLLDRDQTWSNELLHVSALELNNIPISRHPIFLRVPRF